MGLRAPGKPKPKFAILVRLAFGSSKGKKWEREVRRVQLAGVCSRADWAGAVRCSLGRGSHPVGSVARVRAGGG